MMNDTWEFYKDADNKWRWKCTAPNGTIVGASTRGFANKADCEKDVDRSGLKGNALFQDSSDAMPQNDMTNNNKEIKLKAFDLYNARGFKDGNDFVAWLESEKQKEEEFRSVRKKQRKNVLVTIVGILCVVVVLLLILLLTKDPQTEISQQGLSEPRVMLLVIDPKKDENVVVFGDTHFDLEKATLSEEAKVLLSTDVQNMKENPKMNVRVTGYTSAEGTEEINQQASKRRANTVRDYLVEKGIAPERISVIGYGRTIPAVFEVTPGDSNSKSAKANIRVLFEVVVK